MVGSAMQRLLIVSAVVLANIAVAVILGVLLLRRGSTKLGRLLVLVGCLLPLCCYLARPNAVPSENGSHPIEIDRRNKVREGMSGDEVRAILGPPHQRKRSNDRETWIYWIDTYGGSWVGVDFGADGRVTKMYGN